MEVNGRIKLKKADDIGFRSVDCLGAQHKGFNLSNPLFLDAERHCVELKICN